MTYESYKPGKVIICRLTSTVTESGVKRGHHWETYLLTPAHAIITKYNSKRHAFWLRRKKLFSLIGNAHFQWMSWAAMISLKKKEKCPSN